MVFQPLLIRGDFSVTADTAFMQELKQNLPIPALNRQDILSIKRRFINVNRQRIFRTEQTLRIKRQRDFLNILPFLFHINNYLLPGYISDDVPCGVSDYSPTHAAIKIAKSMNKKFDFKKRALFNLAVESMFMMGSSGTIAYSETSDFDIWLCHDPALNEDQLGLLQRKCSSIEKWADEIGLEVHFFLMNAETFRQGIVTDLSSESSGTAQHHLLLEEFYRSSLLIAGRYPIWWLVPPEQEINYDNYIRALIDCGAVSEREYIDFGSLPTIPAEEFFGAAIWQISKGIESPYKSVLKILLMEAYSSEYPNMDLLSHRFKRAVHRGEKNLEDLDPYIMMVSKVEEYLKNRHEENRLELARQCFYFKINQKLSNPDNSPEKPWRREVMEKVVQRWGWDQTHLLTLDYRPTWKFHRVSEERKTLIEELTNSYRMLSGFARETGVNAMISQQDMNILGRKLYAAFERKAGKIEIINNDISSSLVEDHVTIINTTSGAGTENWLVYSGTVNKDKARQLTPLKRARSLVELVSWCHFNKLIDKGTIIGLVTPNKLLTNRDLYQIIDIFRQHFPDGTIKKPKTEDFAHAATVRASLQFINIGIDPVSGNVEQGRHLISNRVDSLSYGSSSKNIALTIDQVIVTTWGEILTNKFAGIAGPVDAICNQLRLAASLPARNNADVKTFCFTSYRAIPIATRIKEVFESVINNFRTPEDVRYKRYIMTVGSDYYVINFKEGVPRYERITNYPNLINYLTGTQHEFSPVVIDQNSLSNTLLPLIYTANKKDVVQMFYRVAGSNVDIYILDEKGSLFHHNTSFFNSDALLNQYDLFFTSMLNRKNILLNSGDAENQPGISIEYFEIMRDDAGNQRLDRKSVKRTAIRVPYLPVQVIGDVTPEGKPSYTIFCNEKEFSVLEHGDDVYKKVASYVVQQRKGAEHYPIYITDLDLSLVILEADSIENIQTVHYLVHKKQIEDNLIKAMREI